MIGNITIRQISINEGADHKYDIKMVFCFFLPNPSTINSFQIQCLTTNDITAFS